MSIGCWSRPLDNAGVEAQAQQRARSRKAPFCPSPPTAGSRRRPLPRAPKWALETLGCDPAPGFASRRTVGGSNLAPQITRYAPQERWSNVAASVHHARSAVARSPCGQVINVYSRKNPRRDQIRRVFPGLSETHDGKSVLRTRQASTASFARRPVRPFDSWDDHVIPLSVELLQ
jgi:hypothetical protein